MYCVDSSTLYVTENGSSLIPEASPLSPATVCPPPSHPSVSLWSPASVPFLPATGAVHPPCWMALH